ncbi:MAG: branched-chain amino acid ABC transporter permease [Opitutaceae bacterium]|jgi:branched-chain amino acid transport system permease protein|nr:branched-chain amino acid ABC transporter permease [Opitutaceae bacterium]
MSATGKHRWLVPALLLIGFALTLAHTRWPLVNGYAEFVLTTIGINIILCASLNLVNGYMGEFSVGHAGFMALGAYASAVCTVQLGFAGMVPGAPAAGFVAAMLAGGAVAAMVGFLLALLSFKTRGDYLAIITLAFLMIVKSALENIEQVGGPRGMLGIARLSSPPVVFVAAVVTIWALRNLVYSKFGRAISAIREDEIAATAMGVRTREAKVLAFVISAFFGGVGGALFAHQIQFINPATFDIVRSTEILLMVYLGGVGSLTGSVLGATVFTVLSQLLMPLGPWRLVILPLLLVLLMLFRPRGILGMREPGWFKPLRERLGANRPGGGQP